MTGRGIAAGSPNLYGGGGRGQRAEGQGAEGRGQRAEGESGVRAVVALSPQLSTLYHEANQFL